jgi:dTDP-4-dehydrorhamnose 3,5-epimerase
MVTSDPKIINGNLAIDDRGVVSFTNEFNFFGVKRFYQVINHKRDFIRAWHGHKLEEKYVWIAKGSAMLGVVPLDAVEGDLTQVKRFYMSDKKPQILHVPGGNFNGFKTLEENTIIIFFSTGTLEEAAADDFRQNYLKWNIWNEDYR